MNLHFKSLLIN